MPTAWTISIFLCMVWVNMFAYVHNMPQGQTGGKIFFSVEYILTHMAIFAKGKDSTQKNSAVEKGRGAGGEGGGLQQPPS